VSFPDPSEEDRLRPLALIVVLLSSLVVAGAFAAGGNSSPGGLDARGGHHCWTNCSRYGLYTGQYHCHRAPCGARDIAAHRRHGH
jgi:hypothetical protein